MIIRTMQRPMDDFKSPSNKNDDRKWNSAMGIADLAASNARAIRSVEDTLNLGPNFKPGAFDVICARGNRAFQHPGNKRFREVVKSKMDEYSSASSKFQKSMIVSHIVDNVRQHSPNGGFVKEENGCWFEVGDGAAREKVGQLFRDLLHTKYKSSTKAKRRRLLMNLGGKTETGVESVEGQAPSSIADKVQKVSKAVAKERNAQSASPPKKRAAKQSQQQQQQDNKHDELLGEMKTAASRLLMHNAAPLSSSSLHHMNDSEPIINMEPIRFEDAVITGQELEPLPLVAQSGAASLYHQQQGQQQQQQQQQQRFLPHAQFHSSLSSMTTTTSTDEFSQVEHMRKPLSRSRSAPLSPPPMPGALLIDSFSQYLDGSLEPRPIRPAPAPTSDPSSTLRLFDPIAGSGLDNSINSMDHAMNYSHTFNANQLYNASMMLGGGGGGGAKTVEPAATSANNNNNISLTQMSRSKSEDIISSTNPPVARLSSYPNPLSLSVSEQHPHSNKRFPSFQETIHTNCDDIGSSGEEEDGKPSAL